VHLFKAKVMLEHGVTPKMNKGQNTLSIWESVMLMAKINFFDPLFECPNGQCGCIELVDYIPYDYLYVTFGVLTRKLYLF